MFDSLRHLTSAHGPWPRRIAAIVCLMLAGLTVLPRNGAAHAAASTPVAVAARALGAGHRLAVADIAIRRYPAVDVPSGSLGSIPRLAGRTLAAPVSAGEPFTAQRVLGPGLTSGLPSDSVALSVPVTGAEPQFVRAGDLVDVVATPTDSAGDQAGGQGQANATTMLAERVRVLAVLPQDGTDDSSDADVTVTSEVVVSTDRHTALRLASARAFVLFTLLLRRP